MFSTQSRTNRRGLRTLVAIAASLLACSGSEEAGPAGGAIYTEWTVRSTPAGQGAPLEIGVEAVDGEGRPVPFTATAEGGCASVSASGDAITVVAGDLPCEQRIILTSATNATAEVTVKVIDPMTMDIGDGLLIRYVNRYARQWTDQGSGGTYDVSYWHPIVPAGWYALGSRVQNHYANPEPTVPMVVVKDSRGAGALAAPIDYALIYNDRASGATLYGSMWKPVCPAGYKALGVVTNGGTTAAGWEKPSLDATRCVKERYTTPGKIGRWLYDDRDTGAAMWCSLWSLDYPEYVRAGAEELAPLHAGTTLGCGSTGSIGWRVESCDPGIVNLLLVPMPVMDMADARAREPHLTGYEALDVSRARYFSSVRVPFTLIPNQAGAADRVDWNVFNSPFYALQREEVYTPIDIIDNRQNPGEAVWTRSLTTGMEQTQMSTFWAEVGLQLTYGGEANFRVFGVKSEVKLSTTFGWEESTSSTYSVSETRGWTFTIPPGKYAEIVQVTTQFRAAAANGLTVGSPLEGRSNVIKYLQYPP